MMTQENRTKISNVLVLIGMLVLVVMAVMPLLDLNEVWMHWAFAAGAFIVLVGRFIGLYDGPSLRIKRLYHILVFSAILYCVSAWMIFFSPGTSNWLGFLLAGVMVQLYASWMIDRESKKTEK